MFESCFMCFLESLSSQNTRKHVCLLEVMMRFKSVINQLSYMRCIKVVTILCKIVEVSNIVDPFRCFIKLLCLSVVELGLNFYYLLLNNLYWD